MNIYENEMKKEFLEYENKNNLESTDYLLFIIKRIKEKNKKRK